MEAGQKTRITAKTKRWFLRIINFAFFYFGWGVCLKQASAGRPFDGAFVVLILLAIHLYLVKERVQEICLITIVTLFGTCLDTVYSLTGIIQYAGEYTYFPWLAPIWISSIWVLFAMSLNHSLSWFNGRWVLASLSGASGAILTYIAGVKVGAATFLIPEKILLAIVGSIWFFLFPALLFFAHWFTGLFGKPHKNTLKWLLIFAPVLSLQEGLEAATAYELTPTYYQGRVHPLSAALLLQNKRKLPSEQALREDAALLLIPGNQTHGAWIPLANLPPQNISAYSHVDYTAIKHAFQAAQKQPADDSPLEELAGRLQSAYAAYQKKHPIYPTQQQIYYEYLYYKYPWIEITAVCYFLAAIAVLLGITLKQRIAIGMGASLLLLGWICNGAVLLLRSLILGRPPVSNMFETIIYVPWIAAGISQVLYCFYKDNRILLAGSLGGAGLLLIPFALGMENQLENVQAVLNSNYWLAIHVLMIVASYGIFLVNALLCHICLLETYFSKEPNRILAKAALQSMYVGVALLIPGTILGGVWAAESWGRFWDWDPKESWAFISICVYLMVIHAYTFKKVANFGLCIGGIIGFQAITFTWYGVNYILGTGLHSYGFGSGGVFYYFCFTLIELLFMILMIFWSISMKKRKNWI